jgi:predicted enzyme related to lactoylglutathione lyase
MTNRVEGIAYNVIPVTDIRRSVAWYQKHFHFVVQHQRDDYAGLFFNNRPVINLKKTDHESRAMFTVNGEQHWVITFYTRDIESLHAQLKEEGVQIGDIFDEGEWGKFFTMYDLDGNMFDIWENHECEIHF